jgi:predicted nuclease of predicted toxin-antitoxin system
MRRRFSGVPESLTILLDQNVPRAVAPWLQTMRPSWTIHHTSTVGLSGKSDPEIYQWAQAKRAIIITFDEDFADRRSFPVGKHHGIIRLRVWPTTTEETQDALERLLSEVPDQELSAALIIIDRTHIRVRPGKQA